jgi:D-alanine-D-alanine ligase
MDAQSGSNPARMPKVGVLSGGPSLEARASRVSAEAVHAALEAAGYEVLWLDLDEAEGWRDGSSGTIFSDGGSDLDCHTSSPMQSLALLLRRADVEVVFPVIHGLYGEDGQIQELCRSLSVPCVGCDAAASVLCYEKTLFKRVMASAGIPVASSLTVDGARDVLDPRSIADAVEQGLGYPCIVKPSKSGSSIGLTRVGTPEELESAIERALSIDQLVLVEKLITGRDIEVGVFQGGTTVVGTPIELEFEGILYDFEAKYTRGDRRYMPPRCSAQLIDRLRSAAHSAFHATGCRRMARVDFLADLETESFVVNEINTIPYMPESSTFTSSICDRTGQSYPELIEALVLLAGSSDGSRLSVTEATPYASP